jgi:hypothetical protein
MKHLKLLFSVSILTLFFSCKKEFNTSPQPAPYIDPSLTFLEKSVSDIYSDSSFYIKGEFNGHKLSFATIGQVGSYFVDTFSNAFYVYYDKVKKDSVTSDNLYLIRQNSNQSIMIALFCGQTHIKNRVFPYYLPHPNLQQCEFTEFQFINNNHNYNIGQNSPQDNYTFVGHTGFGMNLILTKLTSDNIVEGAFEGVLKTNTGSVINVKNGKLRVKFITVEGKIAG